LPLAKGAPAPPEVSRLATTEEIHQRDAEAMKEPTTPAPPAAATEKLAVAPPLPSVASEKPPARVDKPSGTKEEPVYQVFMPPLAYNANAAVQPESFDPKFIVLVRRVRVRPTLIFQGRVEGEPAVRPVAAAKPAQAKPAAPAPADPAKSDSVVNRVRAFLRGLFS